MELIQIAVLVIQIFLGVGMILLYVKLQGRKKEEGEERTTQALLVRIEDSFRGELSTGRVEQNRQIASLEEAVTGRMLALGKGQQELLGDMINQSREEAFRLNQRMDDQLEAIRSTINQRFTEMAKENQEKLEKMRQTVDEKLHHTLEERLGESFKVVSHRLEQVHQGLGEMRALAADVGDLKKVLNNVKTRGILGEIQLESILNQILSPEQFSKNVKPSPEAREIVEFAIVLPGKSGEQKVFLPIDAKFPVESYHRLMEAYDHGNRNEIEKSGRELEQALRKSAKDIHDKYLCPPYTTDFGILFLPVEGLYAEVTRRSALLEQIQRQWKVVVTGPSTFAALVNSLQMGFRTLAIQRQSAEVWRVLSQVKSEFEKFSLILERTQRKLSEAGEDLDKLVGLRSRQILKQLDQVQTLEIKE